MHRPRHGDWSFPKGKLEAGETWEAAALRECEEETALTCTVERYFGSTIYDVPAGPKEVRYFLMRTDDEPAASNEVDQVRWVTPAEALELLSYPDDRELLRGLR